MEKKNFLLKRILRTCFSFTGVSVGFTAFPIEML